MADTKFEAGTVISSAWLNDVNRAVYQRDSVRISDMPGADPTGNADNTDQLQAALATGKLVRLDGFYRVRGDALRVTGPGIVGEGSLLSGLRVATPGHGVTIPADAGYGRRPLRLEGFSIDSVGNVSDSHYAIWAPGVDSGAANQYNSGLQLAGLDIGVGGRFGGGIYLKDFFRVNVQDVGMNAVSTMIRLVGSVVQAKFRNVTSNNDAAASALERVGISTEGAMYADGLLGPENVRFIDCSYIHGATGIVHRQGLAVEFEHFDSETHHQGAFINAPVVLRGGIFGPTPSAAAWVGVYRGVNIATPDNATIFDGVDVHAFRSPSNPSASIGFDLGDGISPVYGCIMERCRVRGVPGSLAHAIRGRQLFDASLIGNVMRGAALLGTGIDIVGCRRLFLERNQIPDGSISIYDGGDARAYGTIVGNQSTSLTTNLAARAKWHIAANEAG